MKLRKEASTSMYVLVRVQRRKEFVCERICFISSKCSLYACWFVLFWSNSISMYREIFIHFFIEDALLTYYWYAKFWCTFVKLMKLVCLMLYYLTTVSISMHVVVSFKLTKQL